MNEDTRPGAALEAPESFRVLHAPLWPRLPRAVGYPGVARWVALYVSSDHVFSTDGAGSVTGDTSLFLAYKRHKAIAPHLAGAQLGSADEEARDWLVIDRQQQVLYLAACDEARRFLRSQWAREIGPPVASTQAELERLLTDLETVAPPPGWRERLAEAVRESRANYKLMQQWLDQHETEGQR